MRAIISCISDCKRGKPITDTRHYALVPLANKELIIHLVEALKNHDVTVLVKKDDKQLQDFLLKNKLPFIHDLPSEPVILIPGDLIVTKPLETGKTTLLTTGEGSEEEEAIKVLLRLVGRDNDILTQAVKAQRVNYPWEFLTANTLLLKNIKKDIAKDVVIEENVTLQGEVIIG